MLVRLIYERMPALKVEQEKRWAQLEKEHEILVAERRAKMVELAKQGQNFREGKGKRAKHSRK